MKGEFLDGEFCRQEGAGSAHWSVQRCANLRTAQSGMGHSISLTRASTTRMDFILHMCRPWKKMSCVLARIKGSVQPLPLCLCGSGEQGEKCRESLVLLRCCLC